MASCPRSEIVREGEVGVYHVWSRCVRRAMLCGSDPLTGRDYSHRRDWTRDFQQRLAALFGLEIGFHAELSNHLHLVLRARPDVVRAWSDQSEPDPGWGGVDTRGIDPHIGVRPDRSSQSAGRPKEIRRDATRRLAV